jgi:hypothetical protein
MKKYTGNVEHGTFPIVGTLHAIFSCISFDFGMLCECSFLDVAFSVINAKECFLV